MVHRGYDGDRPYDFHLAFSFLPKGSYTAHIFADPTDPSASYEALSETSKVISAKDSLDLHMRLAGGVAIYLEPSGVKP